MNAAASSPISSRERTGTFWSSWPFDIAHDLRTPLTVISGYVESLRDGVLAPTTERFDTIYREVQHLQTLVEDLRTLSLADAGELRLNREPVSSRDLLESVAATFSHKAESRRIALRVNCAEDISDINVDIARMNEVFGNLVSNALRYTSEGGTITLSAQQDAGRVRLAVADDGAGIAPEALPHIFERFYRADTSRTDNAGESGLGLAIARSIVVAHGGTLEATSALGLGATFTMTLAGHQKSRERVSEKSDI